MKFFDKKFILIILLSIIIVFFSFYFFTKDNNFDVISSNDLYVSETDNVEFSEKKFIIIHVDGEVMNPGIVSIPEKSRISDAINAAGGPTTFIDISKINLAYVLKDGQKIYVPSIYDEDIEYIQNDAGSNIIVPDSPLTSNIININTATKSELETLPGIGSSTAEKIINYRETNGFFKSTDEVMNISGIGEAKFENIKDYITI